MNIALTETLCESFIFKAQEVHIARTAELNIELYLTNFQRIGILILFVFENLHRENSDIFSKDSKYFLYRMIPEKINFKKEGNKMKLTKAKRILIFCLAGSMLLGLISCVPIEAVRTNPTSESSPLTSDLPKTAGLPPTEIAPIDSIAINKDNIIYPPVGHVKEYFEKGEYEAGVETIKQWVKVWEKMGVFKGLEIENSYLSPVPLDGRARIVCVSTDEKTKLLCPPLDMDNGGLKAVPEEGKWNESDKPLSITFQGTEELVTRGSEIDMTYQFVDKYQKNTIKYIDPKTGQMIEGEYLAPSEEIVLPDIRPETMNSIGEYDLGMEFINSEDVYRMFVEGFLSNEEANGDYWRDLLKGNVTIDSFMDYLRKSVGGPENKNYWWPMTSPSGINYKPFSGDNKRS